MKIKWLVYITSIFCLIPQNAYAMHIMEGYLPAKWCGLWALLALPFLFLGYRAIKELINEKPSIKMFLGLAGAFAFVLSALKIPSLTGSSSHMTGVALGAILLGPWVMSVLGCIVLVFQALLLAHGGLTTLGANVFSMAVVGPIAAYYIFKHSRSLRVPVWLSVFLAAVVGDMLTYIVTAGQLALAFPSGVGGVAASFYKFVSIFAFTQAPLAMIEGLLTVVAVNFVFIYGGQEVKDSALFRREAVNGKSSGQAGI